MVDRVEGMHVLKMEDKGRRVRKEEIKDKPPFDSATSLFSSWHMPEDVRFGGGGCRDVLCPMGEIVK